MAGKNQRIIFCCCWGHHPFKCLSMGFSKEVLQIAIPMASTRCQLSLERVSGLLFEKLVSSCSFSRWLAFGLESCGTREWGRALRYLSTVLNIPHSVLNCIIYLHVRVPEDWLETLFDLFGQSLLVTFGIPLSACWTSGTGGLLNQTHQLNWLFWDIKKDLIEQNYHLLCSWDPWDCKQRKIFKGKWFILSLFQIFVTPLLVWKMFLMLVYAGRCHQIIAWYAFAVKPFWNLRKRLD